MPLKRCLAALSDQSKSVAFYQLANLSDLSSAEVKLFQKAWEKVAVERRREVIDELIALARGNAKLNFDSVFCSCFSDPDAQVRAKAIEGLWECEDCTLISILVEMLMKDKEDIVRAAAASALGRFALLGELRKVNPRHLTKIGDILFGIIDTQEEKVELRCRAIEAIAPLTLPRVKEAISKAYHSRNPKLRASALCAMGLSGDPIWLSILLRELDNPKPEICLEAIKACGELGEEEAVPHLLRLIHGTDIQKQLAALTALRQMGEGEAKQALYQCRYHPDEQVRQLAKEVWGKAEV